MPAERPLSAANERPPAAHPLGTAALVIYLTLALLAIAIPQSLVNWLRDIPGGPVTETLLGGAEMLQQASERAGIAIPYQRARAAFLAWSGKEP
jgi:hypothetical protein